MFCKIFIFYIYSIKIKWKSFTLRTYQCLLQLRKKVEDIIWTGLNLINVFQRKKVVETIFSKRNGQMAFFALNANIKNIGYLIEDKHPKIAPKANSGKRFWAFLRFGSKSAIRQHKGGVLCAPYAEIPQERMGVLS